LKELVVISGKGGTGKTSITASFAALARDAVVADCDVDAADLHLLLSPEIRERREFKCGVEAVIRAADCTSCGKCEKFCRFDAIRKTVEGEEKALFVVDALSCEGCGVCARFCPAGAIDLVERSGGEWFISECRFGPMIHAQLGIGGENSGKLVSIVRDAARELAVKSGRRLVIVDGPPGIGCPVIASVAGADVVLAATEPTLSGEHDVERALSLARRFGAILMVCVNKWDLNPELTGRIEHAARAAGAEVVGRIGYDRTVTEAQIAGKCVVEHSDGPAARDIRTLWENVLRRLD